MILVKRVMMKRLIVQLLNTSALDIARGVRSASRKLGYSWTKLGKSTFPQGDNIKFSGKLICGKEPENYRDFHRVESVSNWAKARGVHFGVVKPEDFAHFSWDDVDALWMPDLNPGEEKGFEPRCKAIIQHVPEHIRLVLDIRSPADTQRLPPIQKYLSQRPLACRHAWPQETGDLFQVKVQFNHFPVELPHSDVKDVIMFDIHHWEDLSHHIQVLGLLEEFGRSYDTACRIAQCELKFFLTSFTRLDPYCGAIGSLNDYRIPRPDGSIDNPLDIVRHNLISPAETQEEYLKVLSRTRLLITFHPQLPHHVLFEALANEIPTAILSSSVIGKSVRNLRVANRHEVPGYDAWVRRVEENLISVQETGLNFLEKTWPSMNSQEILRRVFYHSWDTLWKWVKGLESYESLKRTK